MNRNAYEKLIERINKSGVKHPVTDDMIDILQVLYSEDQAVLITEFPPGTHSVQALSRMMGRDETLLDKILKDMSRKGLLLETADANGDKVYAVLPFEPGLIEILFLRGEDDAITRKYAKLVDKLVHKEAILLDGVLSNPEQARQAFTVPGVRIVAIEELISDDKEIVPWERVSAIVQSETSYAVGECTCKHIARLNGTPCKSDAPSKCCVWFGKIADYMVENGYASRITQEELYVLLKKCEEGGLVHVVGNRPLHKTPVLCNCCKCCCNYLKTNKRIRQADIQFTQSTNFLVRCREASCIGCGQCVDYCQLEALQLSGDLININEEYCKGCGVCVSKCPTQSLYLARVSNYQAS